jgi:hypothetical protein
MAVTQKFLHNTTPGGGQSFALPVGEYNDVVALAADTAKSFTVPAGANFMMFSPEMFFYLKKTSTFTIPAADVTDGTAPELNPGVRRCTPGDVYYMRARTAGNVVITYYLGGDKP